MSTFDFKSQRQIQIGMLNKIMALLSINDLNKGSVVDVLTFAASQEDFAQYVQMAKILRLVDINNLKGQDLDDYAFNFGIERLAALQALGLITIQRAATFVKIITTLYAGAPNPVAGDDYLNVTDASSALYSTSGTLVIGRGTSNEEEINYSVAPTDNGAYWTIDLDSQLANSHALEESVILKQGSDETILAGSLIVIPATSVSTEVNFTVDVDSTLLSGESELEDVPVTAVIASANGNIPVNAIFGAGAWGTSPFSGARAQNDSKFTTGRNRESDDELRDRIKNHIQSLSMGTKLAIKNAIVGLVDVDTAQRVISANIILPISSDIPVKVYIDNGIGFEPSFTARGYEPIIDSATGGEQRFQLDKIPVVKAQVETNNSETYNLSPTGKTLIVSVGLDSETITFSTSDFEFIDSARAEEIITAINARATLIEARTSASGTKIVISAKVNTNEEIQVTGGTANTILGFPTDKKYSLSLYKNDILLSKDGETAYVDSGNDFADLDFATIGLPVTLTIIVDGKVTNTQTVTFNAAPADIDEVVDTINTQLAGATASAIDGDTKIRIRSNIELSSDSKIEITGGTANANPNGFNFNTAEVAGSDKDYTLNRELGTIESETPLIAGDTLSAGTIYTRAYLRAGIAENYAPLDTETLIIAFDGGADQTITFDATFVGGKTAQETADFINATLKGGLAIVREIAGINYLEIRTNTYEYGVGSIKIDSASTGNLPFSFDLDTLVENQSPHKAFRVSDTGPFEFADNDTLVVILDNNIINNVFSVPMYYPGIVTAGASTVKFSASAFSNVFEVADELVDFYVSFRTGANTESGSIVSVSDEGGGTMRYTFLLPPTLPLTAGDIVTFAALQNSENDGSFVITAIDGVESAWIEVTNTNGIAESASTGTHIIGRRRQITVYDESTGEITVDAALDLTPSATDTFVILPSTVENLTNFMNNLRVTPLSLKANIELVTDRTKVQISSLFNGSEGYVQITGGLANALLGFSTVLYRGLQSYDYYVGLLKTVHKTIYGDDTDLVSYPGVGAAGNQFQILAPVVREVSIELDITLKEGIVITQVANDVLSEVTGYINSLGVGEDLILEKIRAAIINISGIVDVSIVSPTINVVCADNQILKTKAGLVIIG